MANIVKGYKQGRGVAFYDIEDVRLGQKSTMVPKDTVVQFITDGKITNAKIQWWQGKPIVRVQGTIELVKLVDGTGDEQPTTKRQVHNNKDNKPKKEVVVPSKVVGKISKKAKNETIYEAINKKEIAEHQKLKSSVDYKGIITLEDLFMLIANDFGLKNIDQYKAMISKKVNLGTRISSMARENLMSTQASMASYLMNMCYIEIRDTYTKYL